MILDYIGFVGAILTTAAFLPQVYKTIKTQQTDDLSATTFMMILVGTICWSIHGFNINDKPLIFANIITGSLSLIILMLKFKIINLNKEK